MNHISNIQLSSFVDGELLSAEAEVVRKHIVSCNECRRTVDEFQRLRADIRTLATFVPATNLIANVVRLARAQKDPQVVWRGADMFARRLVIALAVVVFFIISVGSLNSPEPQVVVVEPGLSGVTTDSTVQKTLLQGEVSEEDLLLAVIER